MYRNPVIPKCIESIDCIAHSFVDQHGNEDVLNVAYHTEEDGPFFSSFGATLYMSFSFQYESVAHGILSMGNKRL